MKENGADQNPVLRDPDVRLMLRAKEGDQTAFTQLVSTYQDRVVGLLTHLLQNQDAAEDLAQEVFIRVYRARHGYVPTAKFATWLFRITNNLARNYRRDMGRRRETLFNVNESGPLGPLPGERLLPDKSGMMPTRLADKTEMCAIVQAALASLNDEQRLVVLLHKFEEMTYEDIAATLDKSPAAVKSLMARARDHLREQLEPFVKQGVPG